MSVETRHGIPGYLHGRVMNDPAPWLFVSGPVLLFDIPDRRTFRAARAFHASPTNS